MMSAGNRFFIGFVVSPVHVSIHKQGQLRLTPPLGLFRTRLRGIRFSCSRQCCYHCHNTVPWLFCFLLGSLSSFTELRRGGTFLSCTFLLGCQSHTTDIFGYHSVKSGYFGIRLGFVRWETGAYGINFTSCVALTRSFFAYSPLCVYIG